MKETRICIVPECPHEGREFTLIDELQVYNWDETRKGKCPCCFADNARKKAKGF